MSSNNNSNDATMAVAFGIAVIAALAYAMFALFAFFAFVLTILAIFAWNRPLRLGRKIVIEPEEARAFVRRGLAGMCLLPAFAFFVEAFLSVNINWDYLPHMMVLGYIGGSLGIEIMMAEENGRGSVVPQQHQQVLPPQPSQPALPPAPREPFRYASWDDEEENRR
jgi:hypothetical protein